MSQSTRGQSAILTWVSTSGWQPLGQRKYLVGCPSRIIDYRGNNKRGTLGITQLLSLNIPSFMQDITQDGQQSTGVQCQRHVYGAALGSYCCGDREGVWCMLDAVNTVAVGCTYSSINCHSWAQLIYR